MTKTNMKMTHQVSSIIYWQGGGGVFFSFLLPRSPTIPFPPFHIRSIEGNGKCNEEDKGSYPPPPSQFSERRDADYQLLVFTVIVVIFFV